MLPPKNHLDDDHAKRILYIDSARDLITYLKPYHINDQGERVRIHGPLHKMLQTGGTLIVESVEFHCC